MGSSFTVSDVELLGTCVEVHGLPRLPVNTLRHALFDFDGTLSLIRGGWQEVMKGLFVAVLRSAETAETDGQLAHTCSGFITRLTGKQTIYQMLQLEEEMRKRGGDPHPAADYKQQYLDLLDHHIADRVLDLQSGRQPPTAFLVRGATQLLETLQRAGVTCYLASGTDHDYVVDEVELLELTSYFQGRDELRIYGAQNDYKSFSKKHVIQRIIESHKLSGGELVAFGDGYVEIEDTRAAGGLAVGVASMENGEQGWDLWKKERLMEVGAQILVPDWTEAGVILDHLGVPA